MSGEEVCYSDLRQIDQQWFQNFVEECILKRDWNEEDEFLQAALTEAICVECRKVEKKFTEATKFTYLSSLTYCHLQKPNEKAVYQMRKGILDIVPETLLKGLDWTDLEYLMCGADHILVCQLKRFAQYQGFTANSKEIVWMWEILQASSHQFRANMCRFVTGSGRVPVGGYERFAWNVIRSHEDLHLPSSATCFRNLYLSNYQEKTVLKRHLEMVVANCLEFDFE